jgi:quinol monooxygenase YgiN
MIIILATLRFQSQNDRDHMLKDWMVAEEASRQEPGLIEYRSAIDPYDPLLMHVLEIFTSADAIIAHHASPHMKTLASRISHIKTDVTARALQGDLTPFDLGTLITPDTFSGEGGGNAISVTVACAPQPSGRLKPSSG